MSDEEQKPPIPPAGSEGDAGGAPGPAAAEPAAPAAADKPPPAAPGSPAPAAATATAEAQAKAAARAKAAAAAAPPWERDPVAPEWQDAGDDPLAAALRERFGEALESARRFAGDLVLEVRRESLREICRALKEEHGFKLLVDICGADFPKRPAEEERFEVICHAFSLTANRRVRVKVKAGAETPVPSLVPVWRGANWPEREVYDMYGVRFADHPDLTRILLWEGFNGHPLRKDFPVEGIDTGSAIYPEYYAEEAGPVKGTGTGWKPPKPPAPPAEAKPEAPAAPPEAGGESEP
jgi:NADH-quinone oxidoreductase subunit C